MAASKDQVRVQEEEVIKHLLLTVVSGVDPVSCSHPNTPGDHCSLPKSSQVLKWWFFFFFTVLGLRGSSNTVAT